MPKPPPADSRIWSAINVVTKLNVAVFRLSGGRVGAKMGKAPVLILHHVGRKSGTPRTTPVLFLDDEPNLVVVASKGGVDAHPAWFHNLTAMDSTEVELPGGRGKRQVRPRIADETERKALWPRLVAMYPSYDEYQGYTGRAIPVVVLEPA